MTLTWNQTGFLKALLKYNYSVFKPTILYLSLECIWRKKTLQGWVQDNYLAEFQLR
jgi:hypothetical protein